MKAVVVAAVLLLSSGLPVESGSWHHEYATWYGPGFYNNRTACGQKLTKRLVGVAHRTLRCGTKIWVKYHGIKVLTRVVDHGPWGVPGLNIDMTAGLSCWVLTNNHPKNCSSKVIWWKVA